MELIVKPLIDPRLLQIFEFYGDLLRARGVRFDANIETEAGLRAVNQLGLAVLVEGEDGRFIWKPTEELLRALGPALIGPEVPSE